MCVKQCVQYSRGIHADPRRWRAAVSTGDLELRVELRRCDTDDAPEDLSESTRAGVADCERDLDQAALGWKSRPLLRSRYGTHQLLGADDPLAGNESA